MSTDNKELLQLQTKLDQVNSFITKLKDESEIAKADTQYPNTLAVYTRLKETYEERIAALVSSKDVVIPSVIEPVIEVVQSPIEEVVDTMVQDEQIIDDILPDIAITEVKKKKK
jgi:hypothetical protein